MVVDIGELVDRVPKRSSALVLSVLIYLPTILKSSSSPCRSSYPLSGSSGGHLVVVTTTSISLTAIHLSSYPTTHLFTISFARSSTLCRSLIVTYDFSRVFLSSFQLFFMDSQSSSVDLRACSFVALNYDGHAKCWNKSSHSPSGGVRSVRREKPNGTRHELITNRSLNSEVLNMQ